MTCGPAARVVPGRARVVREVLAAGPLEAHLRAPVPARGPWLTAVVNHLVARRSPARPVAVVVDDPVGGTPVAAAFLVVRPGPRTVVGMLGGAAGGLPGGRPGTRLLARDDAAAEALADGIAGLLAARRGPWRLDLAGLPLGDPTLRALAARLPTATFRNERSTRLVDDLEHAVRTTEPAEVDRRLRDLVPAGDRGFLRTAARLHAALGAVEVAAPAGGAGGLVTLVDGDDRWPWWSRDVAGLRTEMGAPSVRLTAAGWSGRAVSGRVGAR